MSDPEPTPQDLVSGLVRLLTVSRDSEDAFTGRQQPGGIGRVFGGQVVAQALQAAQATAPEGMAAHSLHAYFLRAGREGVDINHAISRDFEGRSFANRRVVVSQAGDSGTSKPILNLTASFQRPEEGLSHDDYTIPDVPPPEDLPSDMEQRRNFIAKIGEPSEQQKALMLRPRPIEIRTSGSQHWMNNAKRPPHAHNWFRAVATLPDDPAMHRAVIAYASDFTLLGTAALPHGLSWARGELKGASLDHAIWFHRPARADEWLLYVTDSPWSGGGRGFNRGRIFNRSGQLVASVAQEGMIRAARKAD
ncbi:acyl-CoA thioesterase [Qipengyuania marisflavi]|uniref:acyl-CoA thioesterase n=1 Tax=Qipengyuania marisflavi TaxID=2486356 RepID=UPI001FEBB447|nr:acyl-CoA thioesterase domain-containing protein [Qipengyuania marisflavi]